MSEILEEYEEQLWDDRNWHLSLRTDKPIETFQSYQRAKRESSTAPNVDSLPKEQRDWLRAT